MKFYIASGFENKEIVRKVRDRLVAAGHEHTYDWTKNERAVTEADLIRIGTAERDAVMDSDVVLVLLPGGKGTHTELGIALGLHKKVHLYAAEKLYLPTASTFYFVENVEHFYGELDSFIDHVISVYS